MATQLPDNSFSLPGLRSALFLARQPVILWPGLIVGLAWITWSMSILVGQDTFDLESVSLTIGLAPVLGFGAATLTALPGMFLWRWLRLPKPSWVPVGDELIQLQLNANHIVGDEGRGGVLYLGSQTLTFVPHRFNFQLDAWRIPLTEVTAVAWSRVVNERGMTMASLVHVTTTAGQEVFIVKEAQHLASILEGVARTESLDSQPK